MDPAIRSAVVFRWIARITGVVLTAATLLIGFGEALEGRARNPGAAPGTGLTPLIAVIFTVWGIGLAGLLLGWWRERLGGLLSLGCFTLVFVLNLFNSRAPNRMGALIPMMVFCVPSILFLASSQIRSTTGRPPERQGG